MSNPKDIVVIIGSTRANSYSRMVGNALAAAAPAALKLELLDIGHLALYNQDLDANPPAEWVAFKERIQKADGFIFVTPEHNRSMPAALKNALDIASRPYGHNAWSGKPGLVVSQSPGAQGGFGAHHHLRQSLVFLNVLTLMQPEVYLSQSAGLFNEQGELTNDSTRGFLGKVMTTFADWVERQS